MVFTLSGWSAYGHGEAMGVSGSTGMMDMMDLMHDQVDSNQSVDCDTVSDVEMMEKGEDMMDEMLGHEDHERIEEAMEVDMKDHDSMHMMMGMWSSGCVGEENVQTLAVRYGFDNNIMGSGTGGFGWVTTVLVWILIVLAIMGLWKWIKSPVKPATPTV